MSVSETPNQKNSLVNELDLYLNDRLAKSIFIKLKWKPITAGLTLTLYSLIISALLAMANGRFLPRENYISYTHHWDYLITELFTGLVVWGYYIWLTYAPLDVLRKLEASGIIKISKENIVTSKKLLQKGFWPWISFGVSLIVGLFYYNGYPDWQNTWLNTEWTMLIRIVFVVIPVAYAMSYTFLRLLVATEVFRNNMGDISLHPLHPDKVGGLQPLSIFSLKIAWMIIILGIMGALLAIVNLSEGFESKFVNGSFLLYLLFAPIAFFYPLSIAHNGMKSTKEKFLFEISQEFNKIIANARSELKNKKYDLSDDVKKIEDIKVMSEIANAFPIWPFDFNTLRRFTLSMLSPLATYTLPFILKLVVIPYLEPVLPLKLFEILRNLLENL